MPRKLAPCGTTAAYMRHLRRGEEVDDTCRQANNEAKRQQPHGRIRERTRTALTRHHPDEYAELIAERPDDPRRWQYARVELAKRHPEEFRRLLTDEFARHALK